jgi:hypothetical protein
MAWSRVVLTNEQAEAIAQAMAREPGIDWLLENQDTIPHFFHQLALDKKL